VPHTTHISIRLPLSPSAASEATDAWQRRQPKLWRRSHLVRASHHLWLRHELVGGGADPTQLRRASGVLWLHARPIWVEVELSVWSDSITTMAVRPKRLRSVAWSPRYARSVDRSLSAIASELLILVGNEVDRSSSEAPSQLDERREVAEGRLPTLTPA
jgi:hypothetical protein